MGHWERLRFRLQGANQRLAKRLERMAPPQTQLKVAEA
jgi:hypothetical protein